MCRCVGFQGASQYPEFVKLPDCLHFTFTDDFTKLGSAVSSYLNIYFVHHFHTTLPDRKTILLNDYPKPM
jgi:hypothetical protein